MYWLPRKHVLVPTDFSDASVDAIHTALAMVESGRCVHALHIVEPIPEDIIAGELPLDFQLEEAEEARRHVHHERLKSFLTEHDCDGVTVAVWSGDPAITRYAQANDIDLIVIAAHGYLKGERISMGSVTERVLHNADCPVLVLRPDGRIPSKQPRVGVRESNGFAPVENPSRAAATPPR
jgi:nucleotide-binding universal stress UspA family protein